MLNRGHYRLIYDMLDYIAQMMKDTKFTRPFRAPCLQVKSANMLVSSLLGSHRYFVQCLHDVHVVSMQDIYQYLLDNLKFVRHVSTLASKANMSGARFRQVFKVVHGECIQDVLKNEWLKKAATFLKTTAWNINQITDEIGYGSASSFLDAFKRHYGIYPVEFRDGSFPPVRILRRFTVNTSPDVNQKLTTEYLDYTLAL